jgi:hypothetical protein
MAYVYVGGDQYRLTASMWNGNPGGFVRTKNIVNANDNAFVGMAA